MQPELTSIRVMRWVSYVFMGVAVFYATLFWSLGHLQLAITGYFITGILILAAFLLRHEQIQFGKWLLVICTNSAVFYYANSLGQKAGIQLVFFSLIGASLVIFEWEKEKKKAISVAILALLSYLACEWHCYAFFPRIVFSNAILMFIHTTIVCAAVCMLMMPALFYYKLFFNRQAQLQASNTALQTAYAELQCQQNLLEKTWQEYGFTSKLSGTLRLSEIVDLTAKTILLHFGLTYAAPITSNNTSTLHTWTLENQIPVCTREDSFESQICYTYEKGPILPLSVAHLSTSVLGIMNPTPSLVLHLAITENESRYILIGPKNSGVAFSESDMKLLNALSTQAIIALQRAIPYEDAVHRYGMAIKQESAYQMLVSLQHQINSPLSAAKMAMDTLSKTPMENNVSIIAKMGKEALDSVAAVMRRMRHVSQLKETNYLGDIKMWDIGEPDDT